MKIMIVDDNVHMRAFIRTLLADIAQDFVECADGLQAVAAFKSERPDWAVMDVVMKVMDGFNAIELIRSEFPDSKVMIITQHNHPKLRDRARQSGAAGFLLKDDLMLLPKMLRQDHGKDTPFLEGHTTHA